VFSIVCTVFLYCIVYVYVFLFVLLPRSESSIAIIIIIIISKSWNTVADTVTQLGTAEVKVPFTAR
jgi:hypothetical protein